MMSIKKLSPLLLAFLLSLKAFAQDTSVSAEKILQQYQSVQAMTDQKAQSFSALDMTGKKVGLENFRGKVVLLCLWNANCLSCIKELKSYERLDSSYRKKDVVILVLNPEDHLTSIKAFLKKHPLKFEVLYAPNSEFKKDYHVGAYPTNYLIDQNGVIRYSEIGYYSNSYQLIDAAIQKCF